MNKISLNLLKKPNFGLVNYCNLISRSCSQDTSYYEMQHKTPLVKKVDPIPKALYGGRNFVTLLPGGGIGPEMMAYVQDVFETAGVPVDFETIQIDPKSESAFC